MNLKHCTCLILGFGKEGKACLSYLLSEGAQYIGIADSALLEGVREQYPQVKKWYLGEGWQESVYDYDVILKSPGIPFHYVSNCSGKISGATQIFLEKHRDKTIAITGTKGKSTSVSLLQHILKTLGVNSLLGGNIGTPPLDMLDTEAEIYILELSSYQLETLGISPRVGVVLNIFPDHLDHHESFEAYRNAKLRIGAFQEEGDVVILPGSKKNEYLPLLSESSTKKYFGDASARAYIREGVFYVCDLSGSEIPLTATTDIPLKGNGILLNACAVIECLLTAEELGLLENINWDAVRLALKTYTPLPHRLQEVVSSNGILFVNDSISTIPEATINALEVYGDSVETLILGGYDRGIPYRILEEYLPSTKVKNIIFFPPAGSRILKEIKENFSESYAHVNFFEVKDMQEAISNAFQHTKPGNACLLSPAAPSFGMFKNFEERGEVFMVLVKAGYEKI